MFDKHKSSKQGSPQIKESIAMQESPTMSARAPVSSPATRSAVIGPGIEISGDVTASADLTIDGKVSGSVVQSAHNVDIGESGQVSARILAKVIRVAGEVMGDIAGSEKVLIAKTGRVRGNIAAPRVQLDDGAIFKGSIDMEPAEPARTETPSAKKEDSAASAPKASAKAPAKPAARVSGSAVSGDAARKEPGLTLKSH
jgi:cytoskeletal protein CcmA (bactofilin family)